MKSICFFNNKGGVGKTTLVCNIAAYIAEHFDRSVLLVDSDPQCNATQLLLPRAALDTLYAGRKGKVPTKPTRPLPIPPARQTLFDVLQPIAKGEADIAAEIKPGKASRNRFRLDLLPGHPRVALLEDRLSQAWLDFGSGDLGGARRTNWSLQLLTRVRDDYDIVFFDVGPSLGALNRSVLVGVDYFFTPMSCDIFSIMGITNISEWLNGWFKSYARSLDTCREQWDTEVNDYPIRDFSQTALRFVGYAVQQYITKSISGERRATKAYERILKKIPSIIRRDLGNFAKDRLTEADLKLGDVPNMFSLVPLAQDVNSPIHRLESRDGLVGAQYSQKETYKGFIDKLARNLLKNLDMETAP